MDNLYIDNLSGIEFEEYLMKLFENLGYNVCITPASNDYGADLVISKNNDRTVVQAKRYNSSVGVSAIQEVVSSKSYYQANKCMVVTNNYFTPNAVELAKVNDVELWDRDKLIQIAIFSISPNLNIEKFEDPYDSSSIETIDTADDLLIDAIALVVEEGQASISLLQRRLSIGYARAARLIDEMEQIGVISGFNGSNPRKVLVGSEILNNPIYSNHVEKETKKYKLNYLNPFNLNGRKFIKSSFFRFMLFPIIFSYYLFRICLFLIVDFFIFIINSFIYIREKFFVGNRDVES